MFPCGGVEIRSRRYKSVCILYVWVNVLSYMMKVLRLETLRFNFKSAQISRDTVNLKLSGPLELWGPVADAHFAQLIIQPWWTSLSTRTSKSSHEHAAVTYFKVYFNVESLSVSQEQPWVSLKRRLAVKSASVSLTFIIRNSSTWILCSHFKETPVYFSTYFKNFLSIFLHFSLYFRQRQSRGEMSNEGTL